jgi:hypothetical protein
MELRLTSPGGLAITMKPTVVTNEAQREFSCLGHFEVSAVFDGKHVFELDERVRPRSGSWSAGSSAAGSCDVDVLNLLVKSGSASRTGATTHRKSAILEHR